MGKETATTQEVVDFVESYLAQYEGDKRNKIMAAKSRYNIESNAKNALTLLHSLEEVQSHLIKRMRSADYAKVCQSLNSQSRQKQADHGSGVPVNTPSCIGDLAEALGTPEHKRYMEAVDKPESMILLAHDLCQTYKKRAGKWSHDHPIHACYKRVENLALLKRS